MISNESGHPSRDGAALAAVCRALAWAVPLGVTVLRAGVSPEWRNDVALVSSLGFVPVGGEGVPSALLASLASLIPLGGRVLRAGLASALGAALAGALLHRAATALLDRERTPRLAPLLALSASLTATLSPTFQRESTAAGGAALGAALALAALLFHDRAHPRDVRGAFGLGALAGLVLAESRVAALALLAALVVRSIVAKARPPRASLVAALAGCAVVFAFCAVPLFVRPYADHTFLNLGADFSVSALARDVEAPATLAVVAPFAGLPGWCGDLGPVALGLGAFGLFRAVLGAATRARAAALAVFAALATAFPAGPASSLVSDPRGALALLATAALAVFAAAGVQAAALALRRVRVPFAEPAAVLLVVFHFTLAFAAAENSAGLTARSTGLGADVWTDEALAELPPDALVLVRSPELAWRLWAARVARGERPDLVVVPLPLIGRGSVARDLVREEPALAPLIRDVAMTGRTTEYALAAVADARPLFVELDPGWDRRLFDHLRPTPLWLGFVSHTLGRSDRARAIADDEGRRAFRRVLGVAQAEPGRDPATLAVLGARAREQATVLAALGDRESAKRVLGDLTRIDPDSAFAIRLGESLRAGRAIDLRTLLE